MWIVKIQNYMAKIGVGGVLARQLRAVSRPRRADELTKYRNVVSLILSFLPFVAQFPIHKKAKTSTLILALCLWNFFSNSLWDNDMIAD